MKLYQRSESGPWILELNVRGRRYRRTTGTRIKAVAAKVAGRMVEELTLAGNGLMTFGETRRRKLSELVSGYLAELTRRGRCARHVAETRQRLTRLLEGIGTVSEATPSRLQAAVARVTGGKSPRTANLHRATLSGFFGYLEGAGLWRGNPARAIGTVEQVEPTIRRRSLSPEDFSKLLAATPEPRRTLYLLAARTGLRRGELKALTWGDLDLTEEPTIRVRASTSKNRREALLPLAQEAAESLLRLRGAALPSALVFRRLPSVLTLVGDLGAAGLPYLDHDGRRFDFHSLRGQFASDLARAGATPAEAQKLMRHSTVTLTLGTYTRLTKFDLRSAVSKLGTAKTPPTNEARATGTDDVNPDSECGRKCATSPRKNPHSPATDCKTEGAKIEGGSSRVNRSNSPENPRVEPPSEHGAEGGIRTPEGVSHQIYSLAQLAALVPRREARNPTGERGDVKPPPASDAPPPAVSSRLPP